MKSLKLSTTFYLGISGIIASVLVGMGEFYLHYSPNVLNNDETFLFFKEVSLAHLRTGHILIIIGIPFYFGGYLHIFQMLRKGSENWARVVLALGFVAFNVGGIWISSRLMIGNIIHLQGQLNESSFQKLIAIYHNHYEILVQILRLVIGLLSMAFTFIILKYKTHYPKWMAIFNPLTILFALVGIGFSVPDIGKFILPILMNVTHLVMFTISTFTLYKKN